MVCDACANSVTKAIHSVDSDATVNIDLNTKVVTVEATASEAALKAAIAKAGHTTES
ncbi:heavy metal transport/detoxification protein [Arthrospira platensis C1]|nr:heavy metal transport/detoxification protein [Arthrospira platensis C1]